MNLAIYTLSLLSVRDIPELHCPCSYAVVFYSTFQHGVYRVIDSELVSESAVGAQPSVRLGQVWVVVEEAAKNLKR